MAHLIWTSAGELTALFDPIPYSAGEWRPLLFYLRCLQLLNLSVFATFVAGLVLLFFMVWHVCMHLVSLLIPDLVILLYRARAQLEHSAVAEHMPNNVTASNVPLQACSDQPVSTNVHSRPSVSADGRQGVRENGSLETMHQPVPAGVHTETREPWYLLLKSGNLNSAAFE